MRVLTDPAETGAVTICLPQDVQGESYEFPPSFFEDAVWKIRRRPPCAEDIAEAVAAFSKARRPLLIAGGGVRYAEAEAALVDFANQFGVPVMETHAGKGVGRGARQLLGGGGLNGTGAAARLSEQADLVLSVGTRLDDFVTASRSAFQHPEVTFISINVNSFDAHKLGAINIVADAKLAVSALSKELNRIGSVTSEAYQTEAVPKVIDWRKAYLNSLDLNDSGWMSQGGIIHLVNKAAKADDVVIAAAGTPPGEIMKGWDNEAGEEVLLEFGFSCMGHEIPAGLGVRLARPDKGEIFVIIGDGTYLMAPSELLTAVQENLKITVGSLKTADTNVSAIYNRAPPAARILETNFGNARKLAGRSMVITLRWTIRRLPEAWGVGRLPCNVRTNYGRRCSKPERYQDLPSSWLRLTNTANQKVPTCGGTLESPRHPGSSVCRQSTVISSPDAGSGASLLGIVAMVEHVIAAGNQLGESPVWRPEENALYWVDIPKGLIIRHVLATGTNKQWKLPAPIGSFAFRSTRGMVVSLKTGIYFSIRIPVISSKSKIQRLIDRKIDSTRENAIRAAGYSPGL